MTRTRSARPENAQQAQRNAGVEGLTGCVPFIGCLFQTTTGCCASANRAFPDRGYGMENKAAPSQPPNPQTLIHSQRHRWIHSKPIRQQPEEEWNSSAVS